METPLKPLPYAGLFAEVGYGNAEGMETRACMGTRRSYGRHPRSATGMPRAWKQTWHSILPGDYDDRGRLRECRGHGNRLGLATPVSHLDRPRSATGMPRAWKRFSLLLIRSVWIESPRSATGMPRAWKRCDFTSSAASSVLTSEVGYGNAEGMETVQRYLVGPR